MSKLWSEIDGEPWLDNPRRKRRRKGRKGRRRRHQAAAVSNPPRRRRRHRGRFVANRHHRRRHHRNPVSMNLRGLPGRAMDGVKGGLAVLAGEAVASAIPKLIPVPAIQTGMLSAVAEALTALLTAPIVSKMVGSKWAQVYLYGGFARPLKGLVIGLNLPILSPALAAYPGSMLAALPTAGGRSLAANFDATTLEAEEAFVM